MLMIKKHKKIHTAYEFSSFLSKLKKKSFSTKKKFPHSNFNLSIQFHLVN